MASIWESLGLAELLSRGFPEHTAKKIASGELPMDKASRIARAKEQGFRNVGYHTGDLENVNELDSSGALFLAAQPELSATYTPFLDDVADSTAAAYKFRVNPDLLAQGNARGAPYHEALLGTGGLKMPDGSFASVDEIVSEVNANSPYVFSDIMPDTIEDLADFAVDRGAAGVKITNVRDSESNVQAARAVGRALGKQDYQIDSILTGKGGDVYGIRDGRAARLEGAAFDPENIDKPYLMGAVEGGGKKSILDQAIGAGATVADVAGQAWEDMSLLDKAALVTSPIPFVGAGTGIIADLVNMAKNPEERNALNAALLAANFIPGAKIADMGMAMAQASEKAYRKTIDSFKRVSDADKDVLAGEFSKVQARKNELASLDAKRKSKAQNQSDRYQIGENLSESERKEYDELVRRTVNASMGGRMGDDAETILKKLRGEIDGDF